MFKVYCHSTHISQKSCFHIKTNISTGQISCLAFQLFIEWVFLADIPVDQFCLFNFKTWIVPLYSFARDVTETVGPWLVVNHKHDDYASTALTFVNVTNTTSLYGGEKEKEILT